MARIGLPNHMPRFTCRTIASKYYEDAVLSISEIELGFISGHIHFEHSLCCQIIDMLHHTWALLDPIHDLCDDLKSRQDLRVR